MILSGSRLRNTILITVISGTLALAPFAESSDKEIDVETVSNLSLSGYEKGNEGNLQWTLNAATGTVSKDSKTAGNKLKTAKWDLKKLRLTTYNSGKSFAVMESAESRFSPEEKSADSNAVITVTGKDFSVRGEGWNWRTETNGDNVITVKHNVAVAITAGDENERKKISIVSEQLKIVGTHAETFLYFSGNVNLVESATHLSCDSVTVKIPGNAGEENFQAKSGKNELDSIEKITGQGNVRIFTNKQTVRGEEIEFIPAKKTYRIRGNAKFEAPESKIYVAGENAFGNIEKKTTEISAKENELVSVKISSLDAGSKSSATVTSKKLFVESLPNDNIAISFHENVRMTDKTTSINCDKLFITAFGKNAENTLKNSEQKIISVKAFGNVKAISDGRTLRCDEATITPAENKILLTGTPSVSAPKENAALSGDKVEIFWEPENFEKEKKLKNIEVYGTAEKRVVVKLPGIESAESSKKSQSTQITGTRLSMICQKKINTFDIYGDVTLTSKDLNGTCDRMVLFTDAEPKNKNAQSIIKRIEAIGNLDLQEKSTRITGGKATLDVNPQIKEWIAKDDNGSDGNTTIRIEVLPDENNVTGTRPRIYLPSEGASAFNIGISQKTKVPESQQNKDAESYIEGDSLEILAGENRTRFWLRDNIILRASGAEGKCNTLEGLLCPSKESSTSAKVKKFEAEKVICRGNVEIEHEGTTASAKTLEIFPQKNIAVLSGNAKLSNSQGVKFTPGLSDRFIFDLEKRELVTGEIGGISTEQVSRPKITIPRGSDKSFIIPQQRAK